jgi:hypothetical protein
MPNYGEPVARAIGGESRELGIRDDLVSPDDSVRAVGVECDGVVVDEVVVLEHHVGDLFGVDHPTPMRTPCDSEACEGRIIGEQGGWLTVGWLENRVLGPVTPENDSRCEGDGLRVGSGRYTDDVPGRG